MPPAAQKKPPVEEPETPEKRALRVARIKALIQQASSPEGDGVQAAIRACGLIRKFGLDIVDPTLVDGLYKEMHHLRVELEAAKAGASQPSDPTSFSGFGGHGGQHVPFSGHFHTASHVTHQTTQWPPTQSAPPPQPTPPPQQGPMAAPRKITLVFRGKCSQCGKAYDKGEEALWMKLTAGGGRIWCPTSSCYADWLHAQNAAASFNPGFTI